MDASLNVAQQAKVERSLRVALAVVIAEHADIGLPSAQIVQVVRDALEREERILEGQRANERSY